MHKITFQDLAVTPWKNGAGTTRQILIHPADATLDNFAFRISAADINALGPFSHYPGINRSLAVLNGQGLTLTMADGNTVRFTPKHTVVDFDGGQPPHTRAYQEPILDIGVMSRSGAYRHSFVYQNYAPGQVQQAQGAHSLLFSLHDQPLTLHCGGQHWVLAPFDAFYFDHNTPFYLDGDTATANLPFLVAHFEPVGQK